jgi:diaminopimelate epimerase
MRFAKYHGIGNDFLFFADANDELRLAPETVARLCDRRFGVGGDGVIRVAPGSQGGDLFMDYVNSDGSIGEMCGNGIRCLAVFAREEGLADGSTIRVETRAGLKTVEFVGGDRVRVDMGPPIFTPAEIPVKWKDDDALHAKFHVDGEMIEAACLSMGNPHAVLWVDDPMTAPVRELGPRLEHHDAFPNGANVEFAHVVSPERVEMRVWERGSGETLACGTGACAVAVAARLLGGTNERMTIGLPGGDLDIEWSGSVYNESPVYMTGPVVKAFEGEIDLENYS